MAKVFCFVNDIPASYDDLHTPRSYIGEGFNRQHKRVNNALLRMHLRAGANPEILTAEEYMDRYGRKAVYRATGVAPRRTRPHQSRMWPDTLARIRKTLRSKYFHQAMCSNGRTSA